MPQLGRQEKGLVTDLTKEGEGFLRQDGYAVFVPDALPGDRITYILEKAGAKFGHGKLLRVDEASPDRVEAPCPYADQCGGCMMQNLSYAAQLAWKQKHVEAALSRIGGIQTPVSPIVGLQAEQFRYRNKVTLPLRAFGAGMYAPHSHSFLPIADCLLAPENLKGILSVIRALLQKTGPDHLPEQLTVRWNCEKTQTMLLVQSRENRLPNEQEWIRQLQKLPTVISVYLVQSTKNRKTDLSNEEAYASADRLRLLCGQKTLQDRIGDCQVQVSPLSFYQVNPMQRVRLYDEVRAYANLTGGETVLDAYCGAGTIGQYLHKEAGQIYGVEIVPQAIEDAKANAKLNNCKNTTYVCGKAEEWVPKWRNEGIRMDVAILDPPRKGCDPKLLEAVSEIPCIVYVSCDPATLARDLKILTGYGYQVEKIRPFDLFPNTMHVETVVLLSKGEIDSKRIRVEFPLDDMEITAFREKATYPQIKEYVLEQTGLKISSLYISQIKRKCGLDVGDSYNKPKSEDAHMPQCPPEKERAIMDALRHFGLI